MVKFLDIGDIDLGILVEDEIKLTNSMFKINYLHTIIMPDNEEWERFSRTKIISGEMLKNSYFERTYIGGYFLDAATTGENE